jgi:CubicO group peptidase (beta-lactamase class C family)
MMLLAGVSAAGSATRSSRKSGPARRVRAVVQALAAEGIARGVFPGAVIAGLRGRERLVFEAFGHAQIVPWRRPMTPATMFDMASLTKPIATTTAVLQLCERGLLDLDERVATYLPAFAAGGKERVTIRDLLRHTSGLPAWELLYLPGRAEGGRAGAHPCRSIADAVTRICAMRVTGTPGRQVIYSDLGFIVLGHLVERLAGTSLPAYTRRFIFGPLSMAHTRYTPPHAWWPRCAATEDGNAYERVKAVEQGLGRWFAWRKNVLRGQVHDGNAWYLGRGVAGHAGLFSTVADVLRFSQAMLRGGALDGRRVLKRQSVADAIRDQTPGLNPGRRGLGWALSGWTFAGTRASPQAFGHTGFTGTSLLVDPERDLIVVLFTNRVHPSAQGAGLLEFRPAFYEAVIDAFDG